MKTIGLIGGMSWESSSEYYRILNEGIKDRLGGFHSAKCLLLSVDFDEIEALQQKGDWAEAGTQLATAAETLENAGADCVLLCTNTMHKVADAIQDNLHVPFLHIADATAASIQQAGLKKIGLLGTRFTMEEAFYKDRLIQQHGLEVLIPAAEQRELVHRVIYDELVKGIIRSESRQAYLQIITDLQARGAQGVILGCTEIGLLVQQGTCAIPIFDTTQIHAQAAVEFALSA